MPIQVKVRPRTAPPPLFDWFTSDSVCFDTEGTGLIPYGPIGYWGYYPARAFAFAFCDGDGNTAYFRWKVDPSTRRVIPGPERDHHILRRLFTEPQFEIIGHNIAYDIRMVEAAGIRLTHRNVCDTMILAHVVTAGDELTYALKPLSDKYLDFPDTDEKDLDHAVAVARKEAKERGWLIAGGKKEVERGDHCVFAGNKPIKADYWLVPEPGLYQPPHQVPDPEAYGIDWVQRYAVGDVLRAQMLKQLWMPELDEEPRLRATYEREMNLFWVLRKMERRGTRVYPDHTHRLIRWYQQYMEKMRRMADRHGGAGMNFQSPKQLCKKFYIERGLEPMYTERGLTFKAELDWKRNPENGYTFQPGEEETLVKKMNQSMTMGKDKLAELGATDEDTGEFKDPLAKAVLEWRAAKQSIKSFLNIYARFWYPESVPDVADLSRLPLSNHTHYVDDDGVRRAWEEVYTSGVWVLHPNYNQTGAVTGRMTCSDPNLQQVASATTGLRKADIPARPRECFGPRPGCIWYLPDYSQMEVWIFAWLAEEKAMQELLLSGYDFHQGVADRSFVHRPDYEPRKKYYRKLAKLIMFGKLYGGGVGTEERPGRMTKLIQAPWKEAAEFVRSFDDQFANVKTYMKRTTNRATKDGEAWNLYGRKYKLEKEWAYKVVNYMVQGSCADILKVATMRLDWMLERRWPHPQLGLLNSIHDEFIIEVPYELHSQRLMREIVWVMQMDSYKLGLPVPLPVGMKVAPKRWSHTVDIPLPPWVRGGVPRDDRPFDSLLRDMQACPYR